MNRSATTQRPLKLPTKSARARAKSKALWNEARSPESADFFTVGYEGRTTKDLFDALRAANVQCVGKSGAARIRFVATRATNGRGLGQKARADCRENLSGSREKHD